MNDIKIPLLREMNRTPEYLFWVGCAGAFDPRYRKVTQSFAKILLHLGVDFGCLGAEETCTGDPARRAGNEMLYQMQALQVIETLNRYHIKKIITICPHCFNIFKNEYPDLGGHYEVVHHSTFLKQLMEEGKLILNPEIFKGTTATFHDPCYLGRGNGIYEDPRKIITTAGITLTEMKRNRSFSLCCGAGGAQMFKESEPGHTEVYAERTREALDTGASIVATACPFCMTMLSDGIKKEGREEDSQNFDIAEIVAKGLGL
ncbi:MAG: (Fe-S)-binding protein [Bacteroidales bacterium]|jgi:Fe-S oxidoreductase|nr:(Fe-S)-binding protein [Bacteroidales bacterium]NPV36237.1 (Fe-S)-binding protein [Bacteroidales bacterium]